MDPSLIVLSLQFGKIKDEKYVSDSHDPTRVASDSPLCLLASLVLTTGLTYIGQWVRQHEGSLERCFIRVSVQDESSGCL